MSRRVHGAPGPPDATAVGTNNSSKSVSLRLDRVFVFGSKFKREIIAKTKTKKIVAMPFLATLRVMGRWFILTPASKESFGLFVFGYC